MASPVDFGGLLERAELGLDVLPPNARGDASQLLALCRDVEAGEIPEDAQRRLGALVELLSRRTARAIPYATLGRAALAELAGRPRDRAQLVAEAASKFDLFGF